MQPALSGPEVPLQFMPWWLAAGLLLVLLLALFFL